MKNLEVNANVTNELRADFSAKVAAVNEAIKANEAKSVVDGKIEEAKESLKKLNEHQKDCAFSALRSEEDPMLHAIDELVYTVSSLKAVTDKDTKAVSYEEGQKTVRINPAQLEDFCKTQIGEKAGWRYLADDFARFLAARKAKEIGADWKEVCEKFKLRTQTERTEIKDPTSMSNLIERLQALVDAMYFVAYTKDGVEDATKNQYKITSKDVNFVLGRAYGDSKKLLTVGTLKKSMDGVLLLAMEVLNHLVYGNPYNVEYKSI